MLNKIIIGGVVAVLALGAVYFYVESNEEKEMQEFVNSMPATETQKTMENATSTATSTTASAEVAAQAKVFTMSDVAMHATKNDCWLVINNKVLDVTGFVSKHPGGDKILQGCGKDATGYFNKIPGHMKGIAQTLLGRLEIGTLSK